MHQYDLYGFNKLIQEGFAGRTEKVEKALAKVNESLKPVAIHEHFVFTVNEANAELTRMRYSIDENKVKFSSPEKFSVSNDVSDFKAKEKALISNIVEALGEDDADAVASYKSQWVDLTRKIIKAGSILESNITSTPTEVANASEVVGKVLEENKLLATLVESLPDNVLKTKLMNEGSVVVDINAPQEFEAPLTEELVVGRKILEARNEAKNLHKSATFCEALLSIEFNDHEAEDYLAIVEGTNQEFFCLTSREMVKVAKRIYENAGTDISKVELNEMVGNLIRLAELKLPAQMNRLYEFVGEHGVDYSSNMKLLESKMNMTNYSSQDLDSIIEGLEKILGESNFVLSPEIVSEMKKALVTAESMRDTGEVEDSTVMTIINLISQYAPGQGVYGES